MSPSNPALDNHWASGRGQLPRFPNVALGGGWGVFGKLDGGCEYHWGGAIRSLDEFDGADWVHESWCNREVAELGAGMQREGKLGTRHINSSNIIRKMHTIGQRMVFGFGSIEMESDDH